MELPKSYSGLSERNPQTLIDQRAERIFDSAASGNTNRYRVKNITGSVQCGFLENFSG